MPLTPNGKIDRTTLPKPEHTVLKEQYLPPRNRIEEKLVLIWQKVMNIEKVGIRDNFFELGGHSLMAVRLFTFIRDEFGQTLPIMMLYQHGTIEAIAKVIQGEDKGNFPQGISPIRSEGIKVPLFILGAGFRYNELALALPSDRPVFILDPIEDGIKTYKNTVQETAKIFYKNLVNFFPKGPYLLLGHSNLGYFALETARLLIENRKEVAFLGLLDTYPPGLQKENDKFIQRIKYHTNNLKGKSIKEVFQYCRKVMARFIIRRYRKIPEKWGTIKRYEQETRFIDFLRWAGQHYTLPTYNEKVFLFWVKNGPMEPINHWKRFIKGQFSVIPIGGNHMTMFQHPYVDELAKKIEKCID